MARDSIEWSPVCRGCDVQRFQEFRGYRALVQCYLCLVPCADPSGLCPAVMCQSQTWVRADPSGVIGLWFNVQCLVVCLWCYLCAWCLLRWFYVRAMESCNENIITFEYWPPTHRVSETSHHLQLKNERATSSRLSCCKVLHHSSCCGVCVR
jgi:hypothetical protein